jgi:ABC-type uncharacterized transport system substrate-binding protein
MRRGGIRTWETAVKKKRGQGAAGLVASLSRPGGNVTGVAQLVVASDVKRL